jgi:sirohydrochlorin ferrochelatase
MQSLLIISHGSRSAKSTNEINQLEDDLREQLADSYPIVASAFLEFSPNSIPNAINDCIDQGATCVKVLPYFLAAGVHVTRDIPKVINLVRAQHNTLDIEILPHIGSSQKITGLIGSMVTASDNTHGI